jgi:hypothetical protein
MQSINPSASALAGVVGVESQKTAAPRNMLEVHAKKAQIDKHPSRFGTK